MSKITAVTLTFNEEKNIAESIDSYKNIVDEIVILDGCSSDNTVSIAEKYNAKIYKKECGYFERFESAMNNIEFNTDWILFIDADERLTEKSAKELKQLCDKYKDSDVNGIVVNYKVTFMGRELNYGASKLKKLRVFKPNTAFMENIKLDQHIRLKSGKVKYMKSYLIHKDYKGIEAWSEKHIKYAKLASEDYFLKRNYNESVEISGLETSAKIKRWFKYGVYYKLPMGLRSGLFYFYRYYIRFGFLDGNEGKIYTFLHAYWYRFLIDSITFEKQKGD